MGAGNTGSMSPIGAGASGAIIRHADDALCIAFWKNAFVNVWRNQGTLERLRVVRQQLQALCERYPAGIVQLTVLEDGIMSKPMGSAERDEATAISKHFASQTRGQAFVIEGSGFRVATTRMLVSTINLVSRPGYPHKTFDNHHDGAHWLAHTVIKSNSPDADTTTLITCVEEARSRIAP